MSASPTSERASHTVAAATSLSTASVLVTFLLGLTLARNLGAAGKGAVDLSLATVQLCVLLGMMLTSGSTYVVARGASARASLAILGISAAVTAVLATYVLALVADTGAASALLPDGRPASIILVGFGVLASGLLSGVRAILVGQGRITASSALDLCGRLLGFGFVLVVVVLATEGPATPEAALAAVVIGLLLAGATGVIAVVLHGGGHGVPVREFVRYSIPAHLANIVQFGNYRLDLFLIAYFLGIAGVGIYALAASIAQLAWLPARNAAQVALHVAAQSRGGEVPAAMARKTLLLTALGTMLIAVAAPAAIPLMFGPGFEDTTLALVLLLPGVAAFALTMILAGFLAGIGKPRLNLAVSLTALSVTLLLDLILIPLMGVAGAAIATTTSYLVSTALTVALYRRHGPAPLRPLLPDSNTPRELVAAVAGRWGSR